MTAPTVASRANATGGRNIFLPAQQPLLCEEGLLRLLVLQRFEERQELICLFWRK